MRIRRRLPLIFAVLLIAAAVALVVVLRKHAPPEPARLLPSADGFVYANLSWMRHANLAGQLPDVPHDPDYERFIQETGFHFERDMDEIALAMHYPNSQPAGATETRYSEIMVGKIDGARLRNYLGKLAASVDSYNSCDIYNIPLDGRTLRVALLSVDTVAASNHPDPLVIRAMIDRSHKLASPFGGPALLRQYYDRVPLASVVWGIFRAEPAGNGQAAANTPVDFSFLFTHPAVLVASIRYLGAVHLRVEAFTPDEAEARHVTDQLGSFLNVFRTAELSVGGQGPDPDLKDFFDSLQVEQQGERAILSAKLSTAFLRKAVAEAPAVAATPEPVPAAPATPVKPKTEHRKK
jgi:hypothetical protein